jgi:hypothetical protein
MTWIVIGVLVVLVAALVAIDLWGSGRLKKTLRAGERPSARSRDRQADYDRIDRGAHDHLNGNGGFGLD